MNEFLDRVVDATFVSQPYSPELPLPAALHEGYAVWAAAAKPDLFPSRADMSPARMTSLLNQVVFTEFATGAAGERKLLFRFAGAELDARIGEMSRRIAGDAAGAQTEKRWLGYAEAALAARGPIVAQTIHDGGYGRIVLADILVCPLATNGEDVDKFFTVVCFRADAAHYF